MGKIWMELAEQLLAEEKETGRNVGRIEEAAINFGIDAALALEVRRHGGCRRAASRKKLKGRMELFRKRSRKAKSMLTGKHYGRIKNICMLAGALYGAELNDFT